MKILLDENIDVRFKNHFPEIHEVFTVRDMVWNKEWPAIVAFKGK